MAGKLLDYNLLVETALRGAVREALKRVAEFGLPGNHHFYITFKTHAPGVSIPQHLRERFPDEMTIVIQNKFWNLNVREDGFGVGLSFNQIPAELDIPYAAITQFVDPAVDFGLQFQATVADMAPAPTDLAGNDGAEQDEEHGVGNAGDGSNVVSVDFGRKK